MRCGAEVSLVGKEMMEIKSRSALSLYTDVICFLMIFENINSISVKIIYYKKIIIIIMLLKIHTFKIYFN